MKILTTLFFPFWEGIFLGGDPFSSIFPWNECKNDRFYDTIIVSGQCYDFKLTLLVHFKIT